MKLGQVIHRNKVSAAIFEGARARPVPGHTMLDLIQMSEAESLPLSSLAVRLAGKEAEDASPVIPLAPGEVWACGCAYEVSATWRDAEHGAREGFYAAVYKNPRPELFFKGTARVCAGPGEPIGIRSDSRFTAPEAELAVIIGSNGRILGYTIGNDVSAWDIERENPLYLPQSKVFNGCCALGPLMITPDEIPDPYKLEIGCTIAREGQTIFEGESSTRRLARRIEEMIEFLLRANRVPAGTVLLTGTGIIVPQEAALRPGDIVTIGIPEIGDLSNVAEIV
jgi:2-dehydro-3-deoxy-D-arabinonate dehydratase